MARRFLQHYGLKEFLLKAQYNAPIRTIFSPGRSRPHVRIHEEVQDALARRKPVVALESTIITHGMPYPENYETALEVEDIIRQKAVVPATVAVIAGSIHVGLSNDELSQLASFKSSVKISRRGLPASVAFKQWGGTTVSATMLIAHWCGIPIFVTGGIGGVHRHGESTMDVSSDLTELGRTPVTVVTAGVKSILDIPRTLEYLETHGVTVATFGENHDFPAFFTPKSGCKSHICLRSAKEAASLINVSRDLKMKSGCLIGVPIPDECAASGQVIESAVQSAIAQAEAGSISGADVTPFILKRVNEITFGESLKANISLIKNNARVGAEIAVALANLDRHGKSEMNGEVSSRPVVIGGTNIDITAKCADSIFYHGPSNPATIAYTLGGVGRNIAEGLARFGNDPIFLSALGDDEHGNVAMDQMKSYMDLSHIEKHENLSSGIYSVIMNRNGEVELASCDMDIHKRITIDTIKRSEDVISNAPIVCMDGNLSKETILYICDLCKRKNLDLFFEPTESLKSMIPFTDNTEWKSIKYISPNLREFEVMSSAVIGRETKIVRKDDAVFSDVNLRSMLQTSLPLMEHVHCVMVTLGKHGVVTFTQNQQESTGVKGQYFPLSTMPKWEWLQSPVVNVSGSGDTFASAFIHGLLSGKPIEVCTKMGIIASQYTLRSKYTISEKLSPGIFEDVASMPWEIYTI